MIEGTRRYRFGKAKGSPGGKWILKEQRASSDNQPGVGR